MKKERKLTSEDLIEVVPDKFRLTQLAIGIAKHKIHAGADFTVPELIDGLKKDPEQLDMPQVDKAS